MLRCIPYLATSPSRHVSCVVWLRWFVLQMFEMDAFVGVDVLGLSFMKGEQPHAGFPEAGYHGMAEQLARAGYRVVVVEQVSLVLLAHDVHDGGSDVYVWVQRVCVQAS
jgi:DNA mismatch repair ATPase MutS